MRSLRQIIEGDMTEAELEEFRAISTQRRAITADYVATLNELDRKKRAIIDKHKKKLGIAILHTATL